MKVRSIVLSAMLTLIMPLLSVAPAHAAGDAQKVLVYGPSMTTDRPLDEADLARDLGYEVHVASADRWASLTTEQFATYQAIIVGDPSCGDPYYPEGDYLAPVLANRDTWSAAVSGPVIAAGTDPMYHQNKAGAVAFTNNAIMFAASGDTTGMYFSLSCYFSGARGGTTLKVFKGFGAFEVGRTDRGCDNLRVSVPGHPAMVGLTSENQSNWHCSSHEQFDSYPSDWVKLIGLRSTHAAIVIARDPVIV